MADYNDMTIEHIAPQKPSDKSGGFASYVGLIGNLILLPSELNEKVENRAFAAKKDEYVRRYVPMDDILLNANGWGQIEVEARTVHLAKLLYEQILRV